MRGGGRAQQLNEHLHGGGVVVLVSRCRDGGSTGTLANGTRRQGRRRRGGRTGARTTGPGGRHGREDGDGAGAKHLRSCS